MRLYHFINEKYGILNLENRRLKLARIEDLNDPFELSPACPDRAARRVLEDFKREAHRKFGLLCFSERRDNPVQWSHYADKHKGLCLGFNLPDSHVAKVKYAAVRPEVDFRRLFTDHESGEAEINRWLNVKYEHWHYEHEWRATYELDASGPNLDGNFYEKFGPNLQLSEVMIGIRSTLTKQNVVEIIGDLSNNVAILKARPSFRTTYRVVEQRNWIS